MTEMYLGLDENIRKCQNKEPYQNCTTRHYIESVTKECNCVPYRLVNFIYSNKVRMKTHIKIYQSISV